MLRPLRASVRPTGTLVDWEWFLFDRFAVSATGSDLSTFGELLARTDQQGELLKPKILSLIYSDQVGSTCEMLSPL